MTSSGALPSRAFKDFDLSFRRNPVTNDVNTLKNENAIKEAVNVPIHFQDERLSSQSASRSLVEQNIKTGHNKKMIDQRAAAIFLQQFLDINYNK